MFAEDGLDVAEKHHTRTGCLPHRIRYSRYCRDTRGLRPVPTSEISQQCLPNIGIAVIDTIRHLRPMVPGFAAGTVCPVGQTLPQLRPTGASRRSRHGLTVSDGARFFIRTTTHRLMMVSGRSLSPAIMTAQYAGSSSVSTVLPCITQRPATVPLRCPALIIPRMSSLSLAFRAEDGVDLVVEDRGQPFGVGHLAEQVGRRDVDRINSP